MGCATVTEQVPLVEPMPINDIFVDGIARVEMIGPNVRFVFYSLQNPEGADGSRAERVVVSRIVMAVAAVPQAMRQTLFTLEQRLGPTLRLVSVAH